jgi:hypothetical protein
MLTCCEKVDPCKKETGEISRLLQNFGFKIFKQQTNYGERAQKTKCGKKCSRSSSSSTFSPPPHIPSSRKLAGSIPDDVIGFFN